MQEVPETQLFKPERNPGNSQCVAGQMMTSSASNREMKAEPDFGTLSFAEELLHLRARVQELERAKAQVEAENRQLKDLLVNEIPSLLTAMKQSICGSTAGREMGSELLQSLSPGNAFPHSVPSGLGHMDNVGLLQDIPSSTDQSDGTGFMQAMSHGSGELGGNEFVLTEEDGCTLCPVIIGDEDCPTCPSSACSSPDFVPVREMEHLHMSGHGDDHLRQVEVYPGSGVPCDARAWNSAMKAHSPTAMARMLLLGVFDMDTLLQSNLRGGRSRRPTFPNHRIGLDPHKLDAIYNATLARFPLARKGQIGTGINSKLSEIRFRSRRANQERRYL